MTADTHRRGFLWHVSTTPADRHHDPPGKDADGDGQTSGELHLLGVVYHPGTTLCRPHVLLCLAGKVRQRQPPAIPTECDIDIGEPWIFWRTAFNAVD